MSAVGHLVIVLNEAKRCLRFNHPLKNSCVLKQIIGPNVWARLGIKEYKPGNRPNVLCLYMNVARDSDLLRI